MLALVEYEADICECGMHKSVADTDPDMEMVVRICPSCVDLAKNTRTIDEQDRKTLAELGGDRIGPEVKRPADGRYLALRMKPPSVVPAEQGSGAKQ